MASTATLYATSWSAPGFTWNVNLVANGLGAPDGQFATGVSSTSGDSGYWEGRGYGIAAAIGAPSRVDLISVSLTFKVSDPSLFTSITIEPFIVVTSLASAQSIPIPTDTNVTTQTVTFTGISWLQLTSPNFRVRAQATRAASTLESTFYVDALGVTVDYTTGPVVYLGQGGSYTSGSTTTAISSFTLSTGARNAGELALLRVGLRGGTTPSISATDTGGNTWTLLGSSTSQANAQTFLLGAVMATAGTQTVTVAVAGSPTSAAASADTFANATLTVDGQAVGGAGSGSARAVGAFTAQAGDLAYVAISNAAAAGGLSGAPAGFISGTNVAASTLESSQASFNVEAPSGSINWSATTGTSGAYTTVGVALQPIPNQPPTANAGPDQSVAAGATVTLAGTDSDPDSDIASRDWTQVSGPTVTLSGSGATRTFTAPSLSTSSTLAFSYTVTDAGGLTASDTMTVTVASATVDRLRLGTGTVTLRLGDQPVSKVYLGDTLIWP